LDGAGPFGEGIATIEGKQLRLERTFRRSAMAEKAKPVKKGEKKAGIQKPSKKAHVLPLMRTLTRKF
jgi:hypothetical protein